MDHRSARKYPEPQRIECVAAVGAIVFYVHIEHDGPDRAAGWNANQCHRPAAPPCDNGAGISRRIVQPVQRQRALAPLALPMAWENWPTAPGIPERGIERHHGAPPSSSAPGCAGRIDAL